MKTKKEAKVVKNLKIPKIVKEETSNKIKLPIHIITLIIAIIALVISIFAYMKESGVIYNEDCQYRVYIGLTDTDSNYQIVDEVTAKEIIKTVCLAHSVAYTIHEADGGFKDSSGAIHVEKSYVLEMDHITDEDLYKIMDDVITRLNCGAVMYTKNNASVTKYAKK